MRMAISFVVKLFHHDGDLLGFYVPKNVQDFYGLEPTGPWGGHFINVRTRDDQFKDFVIFEAYRSRNAIRGKLAHAPGQLAGSLVEIDIPDSEIKRCHLDSH